LTSTLYTTDSGGKQVVVTRDLTNMFQGTTHLKQVNVSTKWVYTNCNTTGMFDKSGISAVTVV
jgi:hypothetical protein